LPWVSGSGVLAPMALALGLDDTAAVREPIESRRSEALGAEHLGPRLEGQVRHG